MIETIETPLDALSRLAESRSDSLVGLGTLAALIMARIAGLVFALPGWQSGVFPVRLRLAGGMSHELLWLSNFTTTWSWKRLGPTTTPRIGPCRRN